MVPNGNRACKEIIGSTHWSLWNVALGWHRSNGCWMQAALLLGGVESTWAIGRWLVLSTSQMWPTEGWLQFNLALQLKGVPHPWDKRVREHQIGSDGPFLRRRGNRAPAPLQMLLDSSFHQFQSVGLKLWDDGSPVTSGGPYISHPRAEWTNHLTRYKRGGKWNGKKIKSEGHG